MLCVIIQGVIMLSLVTLGIVMLSVVMLRVIMLSFIMLGVILQSENHAESRFSECHNAYCADGNCVDCS